MDDVMNKIYKDIIVYANQDLIVIVDWANELLRRNRFRGKRVSVAEPEGTSDKFYVVATFLIYDRVQDKDIELSGAYYVDGDEMTFDEHGLTDDLVRIALGIKSSVTASHKDYITADEDDIIIDEETEGLSDSLDAISDQVDDIQDDIDQIDEDEVDIQVNNNIVNHYIAECDACQGIFISAMIENDEIVDHITGQCPLCGKESDQYLKWIVREVEE